MIVSQANDGYGNKWETSFIAYRTQHNECPNKPIHNQLLFEGNSKNNIIEPFPSRECVFGCRMAVTSTQFNVTANESIYTITLNEDYRLEWIEIYLDASAVALFAIMVIIFPWHSKPCQCSILVSPGLCLPNILSSLNVYFTLHLLYLFYK